VQLARSFGFFAGGGDAVALLATSYVVARMNLPTLQCKKVLESPATITKFRKHTETEINCVLSFT